MKKICVNCHYIFRPHPNWSPCKCKLCLDSSSTIVKSMTLKQQAFGFRTALMHFGHNTEMTDAEIMNIIEKHNESLRNSINDIFDR